MSASFARATKQLELFVRQLVRLNTPNSQGQTYRKTLETAKRGAIKQGKTPDEIALRFKELEPVVLEPGTQHVMEIFDTLSYTRQKNEFGPLPITHTEIKAFSDLTGTELDWWEVEALRLMDRAYIEEANEIASKRS